MIGNGGSDKSITMILSTLKVLGVGDEERDATHHDSELGEERAQCRGCGTLGQRRHQQDADNQ